MTNYGRTTYVSWIDGTVLELLDFSGISATADSLEITRYGSAFREFVPGMIDYGSVTLTMVTDNVVDVTRLRRSFIDRTTSSLNIVTPIGFQYTFLGFITNFTHTCDKNGLYTVQATVKLSGQPTTQLYTSATIVPVSGTSLMRGGSYGLFLTQVGGNTGGEGAKWSVVGAQHLANTRIIGNTLMIAAEEVNDITVRAQWFDDVGGLSEAREATYHPVKPAPTNVTIASFKQILEINDNAGEDQSVTIPVSASVYPKGADQAVTWRVTEASTGTQVAANAIQVVQQVLTIHGGRNGYRQVYPIVGRTTTFTLQATSVVDTSLYDAQTFTVTLKHAE